MKNKKFFFAVLLNCLFIFVFLFMGTAVLAEGSSFPNPLSTDDPRELAGYIIKAALGVTGSLALAAFVLGGFMWMLSGGSPERVKKGRNTMVWAALGLAVIFFAYSLLNFIFGIITVGD